MNDGCTTAKHAETGNGFPQVVNRAVTDLFTRRSLDTSMTTDARVGRVMTTSTADSPTCRAAPPRSPVTDPVATAPDATVVLRAVADPMRWRIVTLLTAAELCTTHLQEMLGVRQNLVSHHLRVLRDAGLVSIAPCGRFTYYRLRSGVFDGLSDALAAVAAASHADLPRRAC